MTVQYQDFGIGRRNVNHTVANEYTGTLGKTSYELKEVSNRVLADVLKAFDFTLFINDYTGERNFAEDTYNPLSVTIKITDDVYVGTDGVKLYDHRKSWGKTKHRNWLPMKANYINGRTILVQDLPTGYMAFAIVNGVITAQKQIDQRGIAPTPDEVSNWL